ncbi:MAG TPA: FadR/GntR family transcriptional regulator [Alphaproteobacteria bacterium]|nr:FadR/GntR family transcriptional regulator [Alphaproteobacteria bacterium]
MTIQHTSRSESRTSARLGALRPVQPPRNLTREVVERLLADITGGNLAPGSRLPTEQQMMSAMGVSRTVVREAVAALRAEGLVVTRQGVGAFVAADSQRRPFRIDPQGLGSIGEVLHVMELRTGVEVEAAGLAAERAKPQHLKRIGAALAVIDRAIAAGESAIDEDFAFHRAIAAATCNPQFIRFHEFLGRIIIPRQSIRVSPGRLPRPREYLEMIQGEHRQIHDAIAAGDATAARLAMRRHLDNSRQRYRKLAREGDAVRARS